MVLAALAAATLALGGVAAATPCDSDDPGSNFACRWDAKKQGDGQGRSFASFGYGRWIIYL